MKQTSPQLCSVVLSNVLEDLIDAKLITPQVFTQFGLNEHSLRHSDQFFDLSLYKKIYRLAAQTAKTNAIPIGIFPDKKPRFSQFGLLGFAAISVANLEENVNLLEKVLPLFMPSVSFRSINHPKDSEVYLNIDPAYGDASAMVSESIFGEIKRFEAFYENKHEFLSVHFTHQPFAPVEVYERYFNCNVYFGAEVNRIKFPQSLFQSKTLNSDEATASLLRAQMDQELAKLEQDLPFSQKFRQVWSDHALNMRFLTLVEIASLFNMTTRTLSRQLEKEGETYKNLTTTIRGEMAENWLKNTQHSLAEVAYRVGFQDANSFHRFYKQWSGISPGQVRLKAEA